MRYLGIKTNTTLTNEGLYWEVLKMEFRGFCVQYSKMKSRERRNIGKDLSDQIDALTNKQGKKEHCQIIQAQIAAQ